MFKLVTVMQQEGIQASCIVKFLENSIEFARHLQTVRVPGDELHWLSNELDMTQAEILLSTIKKEIEDEPFYR